MSQPNETEYAYVTGSASGLGKAIATMLTKKGIKVFIADRNGEAAAKVAQELNCQYGVLDAAEWKSQAKVFTQAMSQSPAGRLDHVYPIAGIGERRWLPANSTTRSGFEYEMPDLTVLDVDLNGVLYTISLAIQQFRRQEKNKHGIRGKIGCVASVCGFYCVPTLPIYTTAKHGVTGFVRSYGKYLPSEGILLNSVSPNVIRTNISTASFYDSLEEQGLLTPIEGVIETFATLLNDPNTSGEIFEIGPQYNTQGSTKPKFPDHLDEQSKKACDALEGRGKPLQLPG